MNPGIPRTKWHAAFAGVLLGTAVGDALGLPAENLRPDQIRRRWKGDWRMRFILGRGMISDDTEHTLMVAESLLLHPIDAAAFQQALARKFRRWFATMPGGVGYATAKACMRLWLGFPASKAAVHSAGSGPAMRSSIIGAFFADEPERRHEFVLASSRLTHRGWQAEAAALAVAECVTLSMQTQRQPDATTVFKMLRRLVAHDEWQTILLRMECSLASNVAVSAFVRAAGLEKGVTGYALHVVPVAIYAW
ncbi:MAG: ADP-ribosylglycohydrolase family protein, partial [Verrucomicrobiota bacterium]